jgi:hypothetical protein
MARTNFGRMFRTDLPSAEQKFLAAQSAIAFLQIWDLIFPHAGVKGGLGGPVYAADPAAAPGAGLPAITRQRWLRGMTQGIDLLTTTAAPAGVAGGALFGMGGLAPTGGAAPAPAGDHDEVDPLGVGGPFWAPVVEMRRMRINVGVHEFTEQALGIFDHVVDLNARTPGAARPYARAHRGVSTPKAKQQRRFDRTS